jgi:hypothetical protein
LLDVFVSDDLLIVTRSDPLYEAELIATYMLVREGAPDPRTELGTRTCEGGVLSWLRPDLTTSAFFRYDGVPIYAQPGDEAWVGEYLPFVLIIGEAVCVGINAWWPARGPNGETGWVRENEGNQYLLADSAQRWLYCPEALTSRLTPRLSAYIADVPDAGLLLETLEGDSAPGAWLISGTMVWVGYERACVDGQVWWRVHTPYDQSGYMAEGDSDIYFLEPVPFTP